MEAPQLSFGIHSICQGDADMAIVPAFPSLTYQGKARRVPVVRLERAGTPGRRAFCLAELRLKD